MGLYINLLVSIVIKFLELIYLPVLLILAFAFPFYMVFVRDGAAVFVSYAIIYILKRHASVCSGVAGLSLSCTSPVIVS